MSYPNRSLLGGYAQELAAAIRQFPTEVAAALDDIGVGGGSLTAEAIAAAQGYVSANKAGDTFAGRVSIVSEGTLPPLAGQAGNPQLIDLGDGSDFTNEMVAATSDGYAGAERNWGFVAADGDVDPFSGDPATPGTLYSFGAFWMQMEDTTDVQSLDWGVLTPMYYGGAVHGGYHVLGNSAGDIGLGHVLSNFATTPTPVDTANLFIKGTTGQVAVIGTVSNLNAAAKFQVDSTTMGFLPPRMTTTQRDAITSPPEGLMIANTTTHKIYFYNGSAWGALS